MSWKDKELGNNGLMTYDEKLEMIKSDDFEGMMYCLDNNRYLKIAYNLILERAKKKPHASYFTMKLFGELKYNKDSVENIIYMVKPLKMKYANEFGITLHRIEQLLTECTELNLLERLDRGVYRINSDIIIEGGISDAEL